MKCAKYIAIGVAIGVGGASAFVAYMAAGVMFTKAVTRFGMIPEAYEPLSFFAYMGITMGAFAGAMYCREQGR